MPEEADPAAAIKKGELKFVVQGEHLHGGWVLVRIKNRRPELTRRTTGCSSSIAMNSHATMTEERRWPKIVRSRRAARWPISPLAGAGALRRSFSPPSIEPRPMLFGARIKVVSRNCAQRGAASDDSAPKAPRSKAVSRKHKPRGSDRMPGFRQFHLINNRASATSGERRREGRGYQAHSVFLLPDVIGGLADPMLAAGSSPHPDNEDP